MYLIFLPNVTGQTRSGEWARGIERGVDSQKRDSSRALSVVAGWAPIFSVEWVIGGVAFLCCGGVVFFYRWSGFIEYLKRSAFFAQR